MYGSAFYDTIRAGCQSSAAVIALTVNRIVNPASVIDVGCGEGWFARAFNHLGATRVLGIDGDYVDATAASGIPYRTHDLTTPLPVDDLGTYDLAVCLEVAEHLPPAAGDRLIADLCELSDVVLFSAAIPGQGGAGHINEQWPGYWVSRFAEHDYAVSGALRWMLWDLNAVEPWYRQNLLVAVRLAATPGVPVDARYPELFGTPTTWPYPLVHPTIYDWRRGA